MKWNTKKKQQIQHVRTVPIEKYSSTHTYIHDKHFILNKISAEVDSCKLLVLNVVVCSKYVEKNKKK
jgi:hypothetical protein